MSKKEYHLYSVLSCLSPRLGNEPIPLNTFLQSEAYSILNYGFHPIFRPIFLGLWGKRQLPWGIKKNKNETKPHKKENNNKWKSRILLNANYLSRAGRMFPFPKEQMTLSVQRRVSTICLVYYTKDEARCLGAHSIIH